MLLLLPGYYNFSKPTNQGIGGVTIGHFTQVRPQARPAVRRQWRWGESALEGFPAAPAWLCTTGARIPRTWAEAHPAAAPCARDCTKDCALPWRSPLLPSIPQVVWASTTQVGCGVATCPPDPGSTKNRTLVVCRYSPPGERPHSVPAAQKGLGMAGRGAASAPWSEACNRIPTVLSHCLANPLQATGSREEVGTPLR